MSNDRVGRRPEEIDEARHSRAKGTVVVRAIADELTQIAVSGGKIRLGKLKHLHSQLFKGQRKLHTGLHLFRRESPSDTG